MAKATKAAKCYLCGSIDPVKKLTEGSVDYYSYSCERCSKLRNPEHSIPEHLKTYKEVRLSLGEELLPCGRCNVAVKDCTCTLRCVKCFDTEYRCTCNEFITREEQERRAGIKKPPPITSALLSDLGIELKDI